MTQSDQWEFATLPAAQERASSAQTKRNLLANTIAIVALIVALWSLLSGFQFSSIGAGADAGNPPASEPTVIRGLDGAPGADGRDGADGSPGADGADGIDGVAGQTGATGAPGATGAQGLIGLQGPTGLPGEQGIQGPQGLPGPAGSAGPPGQPGADGEQGIQGPQGIPGPAGPAGPAGQPGTDGLSGIVIGGSCTFEGNHGHTGLHTGTIQWVGNGSRIQLECVLPD